MIPEAFRQRMEQQLGDEAPAFFRALTDPPETSIRLNHHKGKTSFAGLEQVPWCEEGYYLETRPYFHIDPHWHAGSYYVQEASSMILDEIIRQLSIESGPKVWLDLCAAPGGKTGIMAKYIGPGDLLIANEIVSQRKNILFENLYKGGYLNTLITGLSAGAFPKSIANLILVDAPCAGEGMMRKDPEAVHQWTPKLVEDCAVLQQKILQDAAKILMPGGYLIYSTCSYSHSENMANLASFTKRLPFKSVSFDFPAEWNIVHLEEDGLSGYQLYPHKVKGEGLFIAVLKNEEESNPAHLRKSQIEFSNIPDAIKDHIKDHEAFRVIRNDTMHSFIRAEAEVVASNILKQIPNGSLVAEAGELKGKDFIPAHFLAMSNRYAEFPKLELGLNECLDYLERSTKTLPAQAGQGWHLIDFQGSCLGWVKNTMQGWKNYYPLQWRLRSRKTS